MAAEVGEITQDAINTFLIKKQPKIYYNTTSSNGGSIPIQGYDDIVSYAFTSWIVLAFTGFFTAFITLDDIDACKTVNEGTDFEYEMVTNEGQLYMLALTIFAPLILASSFAAIYYCLTKPDIILDEADRNSPEKETKAKNDWAREQLEASRNKPRSFFSWGAKKHTDDINMEPLMASNAGSINHHI